MQTRSIAFIIFALGLVVTPANSFANKASVKIEVTPAADSRSEVVIKILVFHHGNNLFHHVEWVDVEINNKPLRRWEFSAFHLPESGDFSREITYKVEEAGEIVGQASCNIHGSTGPATSKISPAP